MSKFNFDTKAGLLGLAREKLQLQIKEVKDQLENLMAAGAEEGKSSAGDKYETQREMIKQSRDVLDAQLSRIQQMLAQLERTPTHSMDRVQEGALLKLSIGQLWISVSLGSLMFEGNKYQLISKESPLYLALKGLKSGESGLFRGRGVIVEEVA